MSACEGKLSDHLGKTGKNPLLCPLFSQDQSFPADCISKSVVQWQQMQNEEADAAEEPGNAQYAFQEVCTYYWVKFGVMH